MKTGLRSLKATKTVPLFSTVLLLLAALLSFAAWRVLEINQNQPPRDLIKASVPKELSASDSGGGSAAYQAHRHQAMSLGSDPATRRVIRGSSGAPSVKNAAIL